MASNRLPLAPAVGAALLVAVPLILPDWMKFLVTLAMAKFMAVLAVARSLGLPVLAEGVETAAQRDLLLQLGCALGQGAFFAAPLAADDAVAMIADRSSLAAGRQRTLDFPRGKAGRRRRQPRRNPVAVRRT